MVNIITGEYQGHSPFISVSFSYNVDTGAASVNWSCGGGYFGYYYFYFYIMFQDKNGNQSYSKIGGMAGSGNNIWYSGSANTTIAKGNNTKCGFGIACNCPTCLSGLFNSDGSPVLVDGWYEMVIDITTTKPVLSIQSGEYHTRPDDKIAMKLVSKYTNKVLMHWKLSGTSKAVQLASQIQDTNLDINNGTYTHSPSNPYKFTATLSGDLQFSKCKHSKNGSAESLLPFHRYYIRVATASTTENIVTQWNDGTKRSRLRIRTREESPYINFVLRGKGTDNATIAWSSTYPTLNDYDGTYHYCRLNYLTYKVTDTTTNKVVKNNQYIVKNVEEDDVNSYYGSFKVEGLTPGHSYKVEPQAAKTLYDRLGLGTGVSVSFSLPTVTQATPPAIESVYNVGSDLIFGEPDDDPKFYVKISGTSGQWKTMQLLCGTATDGTKQNIAWGNLFKANVNVGINEIKLSDYTLDMLYRYIQANWSNSGNEGHHLFFSIKYESTDGLTTGTDTKHFDIFFKGNAKTFWVGVNGTPKRAKGWIGVNGTPKRIVSWVGVANAPKRASQDVKQVIEKFT